MFIKFLNSTKNIYQVITTEFKGIGMLVEHNEVYTKLAPHNNKKLEAMWPNQIEHTVYIPTKEIKLLIQLTGDDNASKSSKETASE